MHFGVQSVCNVTSCSKKGDFFPQEEQRRNIFQHFQPTAKKRPKKKKAPEERAYLLGAQFIVSFKSPGNATFPTSTAGKRKRQPGYASRPMMGESLLKHVTLVRVGTVPKHVGRVL